MVDDDWRERNPDSNRPSYELGISSEIVDNVCVCFGRGDNGADDIAPNIRKNEKGCRSCPETAPEDGQPDRPPNLKSAFFTKG